jgi:hypothetical protein
VTFPASSSTNKAGLIVGHDGANSYYAVVLDRNEGKLAVHKVTSGSWSGAIDSVAATSGSRESMMSYGKHIVIAFLGLGLVAGSGCGITPSWPYTVDLSGFREFHTERTPRCQDVFDQVVANYVCEASIVRQDSGDYVFQGSYTGPTEMVEVLPRKLTEAEITKMLAIFSDLHYDLANQPFCHHPLPGYQAGEDTTLRWDDREFITLGCGQPRIHFGQVNEIQEFLRALVESD